MTTFDARARPLTSARRREKRRSITLIAVTAVAVIGILSYRLVSRTQTTDDARVEQKITGVASELSGRVHAVHVQDNQVVEAGQLLLDIESDELATQIQVLEAERDGAVATVRSARAQVTLTERAARAMLTQAKGGVLQAGHGLRALNAATEQVEHELGAARALRRRLESEQLKASASSTGGTSAQLAAQGSLPALPGSDRHAAQALEDARTAEARVEAQLRRLMADRATSWGGIVTARGKLDEASSIPEQVELARANVAQAEANLAEAEARLKLAQRSTSAGTVRAPVKGTVSQLKATVGQLVTTDQPVLDIIAKDDSWIAADFEADQLDNVHPGQPAEVTISALPDETFAAHVVSFVGATKVVLRFDDPVDTHALKLGMPAAVRIHVKD